MTLRGTFKQMAQPAKDDKYRNLVFTSFFIGISGSIFGFLLFPFQTYLLEFVNKIVINLFFSDFLLFPLFI